jgi:peptide/nickel transport system permease protein
VSRFILRRLMLMIPVLLGVTLLTFVLTNLLPGDPARSLAGKFATPEQVEATRQRLGLDQPLSVQYMRYLGRLVQGDLGTSISSRQPVLKELLVFFPPTLELTVAAMTLTIVIGIPLGTLSGVTRSRWFSSLIMSSSLVGVGIPVFWLGLVAQLIFFGRLRILPLCGRLDPRVFSRPPSVTNMYTVDALLAGQWATFGNAVKHLILPGFTLALPRIASVARITHASIVEVMRNDYIRTARAKGLRERIVVIRHALKNALLPTVTTVTLQIGWLLGGTILVENIFSWGGLGTYAWIGIFRLDIPVVMGLTLVTTTVFLLMNLLADIVYRYLDPRITYE